MFSIPLLAVILSFLPTKDRATAASRVCKAWETASRSRLAWPDLVLGDARGDMKWTEYQRRVIAKRYADIRPRTIVDNSATILNLLFPNDTFAEVRHVKYNTVVATNGETIRHDMRFLPRLERLSFRVSSGGLGSVFGHRDFPALLDLDLTMWQTYSGKEWRLVASRAKRVHLELMDASEAVAKGLGESLCTLGVDVMDMATALALKTHCPNLSVISLPVFKLGMLHGTLLAIQVYELPLPSITVAPSEEHKYKGLQPLPVPSSVRSIRVPCFTLSRRFGPNLGRLLKYLADSRVKAQVVLVDWIIDDRFAVPVLAKFKDRLSFVFERCTIETKA